MPGAPTADFERLGAFYLGRPLDLSSGEPGPGVLLYDSKDLVTHAVCVGMTGSGKTGLCLALIEEAGLDGIPAILIDPKGDLGNLLLTFPALRPEDFRPWIVEDEARRQGVEPDELAAREARRWAEGLAAWGQDGARIARFRQAVDLAIYTPGSTAGRPLSVLASLAAPPAAVIADAELLGERVTVTAASLLGLIGVEADPVQRREHILLSTLLQAAWQAGRDLDLPGLVQQIQAPPVERFGVMDLETFYPARERFLLAMAVNNLLGAPGFAAWREGEPLDPARLLYTTEGKPRLSIVSIAHLGDRERMFVVSLLLSQVVAWMRAQRGTTSLRAIVYMDEIAGFFPPVATPPSKGPLLTLLKQARAYGVGVVLATQNPVDLDYKGLANAGTWFVGRLQTERDKARLLEGLEGAAAGGEGGLDRAALDAVLGGLRSRIFLLHNVHDAAPVVFETRWAMSYLRGPLTRAEIRALTPTTDAPPAPAPSPAAPTAAPATAASPAGATEPPAAARPVLPPEVPEHFLAPRRPRPEGAALLYTPVLVGFAALRYRDRRQGVDTTEDVAVVAVLTDAPIAVDWERAREVALTPEDLEREPGPGARFAPLPATATSARRYEGWRREMGAWLQRHRPLTLLRSPSRDLVSRPGESERDFRLRLVQQAHEERDAVGERLRQKYAPRIAALQERIRRAEARVSRESAEATQSQVQAAISIGATLLGAFLGRKAVGAGSLGRATTAARSVSRTMRDRQDIGRASEDRAALQERLAALEAEFKAEVEALTGGAEAAGERFEPYEVRATRGNVTVRLVALAWTPSWQTPGAAPAPAWE